MTATPRDQIGTKRDRFLVILVGVVAGYVLGRWLAGSYGWERAGIFTMPLGGLIAGVLGRFAFDRFRPDANDKDARRLR